ncbi:MAG: protein-L-isoaspartate(D-aspartate) O-methyltransferase [Polyangiaceae bacterium]|nr:protein-L-isoaspartate(D-aspartate) O-methyltransferase [Polyangiaceae bacterium]
MVRSVELAAAPRDPRVLDAFRRIPRHLFVPDPTRVAAYEDRALPIGEDQTISQPSMIAMMLDALECDPGSRVLEVGAGSGYAAALLSCLAARVDAIEIRPALAARARATLLGLGIENAFIHVGDGSKGLAEQAPFDRILVSAAPRSVPPALLDQLGPAGRIAIPVGDGYHQVLLVGERGPDGRVRMRRDVPCVFVPLVEG